MCVFTVIVHKYVMRALDTHYYLNGTYFYLLVESLKSDACFLTFEYIFLRRLYSVCVLYFGLTVCICLCYYVMCEFDMRLIKAYYLVAYLIT